MYRTGGETRGIVKALELQAARHTGQALARELGKVLMDTKETNLSLNEMGDDALDDGLLWQRILEWLSR